MYEIKENSRILKDGTELTTYTRDVVSANILQPEDVEIVRSGGNRIVAIFVPRASFRQRPVYLGGDPFTGSYYRRGDGDYRCPRHEVEAMLRDRGDPHPLAGLPRR